ncbi:prepilin-type N-terminal cleavage/methylation domain-containing protein [Ureibacillus xyleni]|uniref:Prepilin-type N-terminal cleavage/methylation domain-containing protein n=1 Tax=Ureibacillus xyleni TaxID=614648 RepID=A0A285RJN7_9BACL|nr:prepilin-type N-terminal cleavage/methylation domain-containing protein [Ureibacillus xyleni]
MILKKHKLTSNESGVSLIEVVASIVILSIILVSIYTMLTQSARTTKNNEDIVKATYLAQTEMEYLYSIAPGDTDYHTFLGQPDDITSNVNGDQIEVFKKNNSSTSEYIEILVIKKNNIDITLPIIKICVYDKEGGTLKAQMQNIIDWGAPR